MDALKAKSVVRSSNQDKKKPVRCGETGVVYASSRDAAEILASEEVTIAHERITHV
jgi:hypothetical protein